MATSVNIVTIIFTYGARKIEKTSMRQHATKLPAVTESAAFSGELPRSAPIIIPDHTPVIGRGSATKPPSKANVAREFGLNSESPFEPDLFVERFFIRVNFFLYAEVKLAFTDAFSVSKSLCSRGRKRNEGKDEPIKDRRAERSGLKPKERASGRERRASARGRKEISKTANGAPTADATAVNNELMSRDIGFYFSP